MTRAELQNKYPEYEIYCLWSQVPEFLKTRSWFKARGVIIKGNSRVQAVKCNVGFKPERKYFLFKIDDFRDQLQCVPKFKVKAIYSVNHNLKSEVILETSDQETAQAKLKEVRGKLYLGMMAVYEIEYSEEFKAKL